MEATRREALKALAATAAVGAVGARPSTTNKVCLIQLDDVSEAVRETASTPALDYLVSTGRVLPLVAAPNCSNFRAKVETGRYSIRPENG